MRSSNNLTFFVSWSNNRYTCFKTQHKISLIFVEYFMVVENALATYKPECVSQIKKANQMMNYYLKTDHGAKIIENKFK